MNRCPITYKICEGKYSLPGIHLLSKHLKNLKDFPYTAQEQVEMAARFADKLSIQGFQPKLSAILSAKKETFEIVEKQGRYILKPPHYIYTDIPQNEDLTMRLAKTVGIDIPLHGLIYNKDGSFTYFIKRFDRLARGQKLKVEDFSQLMGETRDAKYDASMEKLIPIIEQYCSFPMLEKLKFFRLLIFNFLIGNEDMHLKNFSLIHRDDKIELSPAYDLLNSCIITKNSEEIALPIRGKKSRLKREDLVDYYGHERLKLSQVTINQELNIFTNQLNNWKNLIDTSFLSHEKKLEYRALFENRWERLHA